MRAIRRTLAVGAIGAALAGCGGSGAGLSNVKFGGAGDTATFVIDGRTISVTESGSATVKVQGAPEVNHHGPVGCAAGYFTADFTDGVPMFFRFGNLDAYLLVGSDLYYLGEPPSSSHGRLEWQTTTGGHEITIRAACRTAPATGRLPVLSTPSACSVLTARIATEALRMRVGAPNSVFENADLSYCSYSSRKRSFDGDRRIELYVGSAGVITQLSSWAQPKIAGIGQEAHGGDAGDGLAVRQGKIGIELTIDLGANASGAVDLAAEERLAHTLVAQLPR